MTGPDAASVVRDMCDLWPDERARRSGTLAQYTRRLLELDVRDARVGIARLADHSRRSWPLWSEVRESIDAARQDRVAAESLRRGAIPEHPAQSPLSPDEVQSLCRLVGSLMRGDITSDEYRRRVASTTTKIRAADASDRGAALPVAETSGMWWE